jgi:hypothetical protein
MMVPLLLYAYSTGVRSSRKIEALCETDVAFRVVAGNRKPDHATIARFRRNNLKELEGLFTQILRLCAEAGLVKVGVVAIDGTKVAANAALSANRTHEGLGKEIEREVAKMLAEAESVDAEEDARYGKRRGDELPEGLRTQKSRIERLRECKERMERAAEERAAEQQRKIDERAAKERETGERLRGRKPNEPDATVEPEAKANVTDPESRIMKTPAGYVQGYNAQAAVTEGQIVVATTKDWKRRKALRERAPPRGRIPRGLSCRERMERKLATKRGRGLYKKRSQTVEPVFGQVKYARGIDRFLLRGLEGASAEWKLACGTHNLLKLWRSGRASWN